MQKFYVCERSLGLQIANPQITNFQGEKVFTCGLAEVLSLRKKLGSANRKSTICKLASYKKDWVYELQIRKELEVCKSNKL
jgi:hypothetical protein